jgi:hypothetical protein
MLMERLPTTCAGWSKERRHDAPPGLPEHTDKGNRRMNMQQPVVQFVLTYDNIRRFDERLKAIEKGVTLLLTRDAEVVALRAEVAALEAAGKISAEEKAAMTARVVAATERTQKLEDKEAAAIPSNSQPPA